VSRLEVRKTYKLFINGAFPRSESGRTYEVTDAQGDFLANAVRGSRKDIRDAVSAARKAAEGWKRITGYNRGQVLYRVAEVMETRRAELIAEVTAAEGRRGAAQQVDKAIDTWVWYAGWTDKVAQVMGGINPVAGPYFNITSPEPIGLVGLVAPAKPSLLGLVERVAPALCGGNTVVVLASEPHPLVAVSLAECMATSDVPPGVINLITGFSWELVPVLAGHLDVDAIDVTGVAGEALAEVENAAAENVKRIVRAGAERSPFEVTAFQEMKTVWHPKGT
jgi:acyl-CoA reductase-like NAD-dependent aldehyde dehydrogenase